MNFIEAPDGDLINLERLTSISPPRRLEDEFQIWGHGPNGLMCLVVGTEADCQRFWAQIKERVGVSETMPPPNPLFPIVQRATETLEGVYLDLLTQEPEVTIYIQAALFALRDELVALTGRDQQELQEDFEERAVQVKIKRGEYLNRR